MPFVPSLTKIAPRRVHRNDKLNLLNPQQSFELLFPVDGLDYLVKTLVVDEAVDFVAGAEFRTVALFVQPYPGGAGYR